MDKIVIYGTGGFSKEVHEIIKVIDTERSFVQRRLDLVGFLDDDEENHGKEFHGSLVLGGMEWLNGNEDIGIVVAVGNPIVKKKIVEKIKKKYNNNFPSLIHPNAQIDSGVEIGEGVIICAGNYITTDIVIKNFVSVNLNCTIGHDSLIEDYVNIAPGVNISGDCVIKEGVDFGTGGTIIQGNTVNEWSIVGAGSVVVKEIPANTTSVGNPSKVIKEREVDWHL